MPDKPQNKPLGARIVLRRRLTPSYPAMEVKTPALAPSNGAFPSPVLALQQRLSSSGFLTQHAWMACAIHTLVGKLVPVRFDQVGPMGMFIETENDELYAYDKGNAGGLMGYGEYLGTAARAFHTRPLNRASIFHNPEIVYVFEAEAINTVARFPGALLHIEHSVLWYETNAALLANLYTMRRHIRARYR